MFLFWSASKSIFILCHCVPEMTFIFLKQSVTIQKLIAKVCCFCVAKWDLLQKTLQASHTVVSQCRTEYGNINFYSKVQLGILLLLWNKFSPPTLPIKYDYSLWALLLDFCGRLLGQQPRLQGSFFVLFSSQKQDLIKIFHFSVSKFPVLKTAIQHWESWETQAIHLIASHCKNNLQLMLSFLMPNICRACAWGGRQVG